MRRLIIWVIDSLALYGASSVVYHAHGLAWAIVAVIAVGAYSCVCYVDGFTRAQA